MRGGEESQPISVRGIDKTFYPASRWLRVLIRSPITSEIHALRSVDLDVRRGEVCALVGPNGAGKSTLFRILVGLTTPTNGSVHVLGHDAVTESLAIRRKVGWMPTSDQTLFKRHTCAANLRLHSRLGGVSGPTMDEVIYETLEMVGLSEVKDNAVVSLSAGMTARLQLARALLHNPSLLILDEPTASVDPVAAYGLIKLIENIVRERQLAAIVSSHRLDEIEALPSHVVLLHLGEVLFDGHLDALREKLDHPRIELEFSSSDRARQLARKLNDVTFVESMEASGRALNLVLSHGSRVGAILGQLHGDLDALVAVREKTVPLRDLLAEAYGVQPDEIRGKP